MYAMMLADPKAAATDLSSLTRCAVGGHMIAIATIEEWERRSGAPLLELCGMTEIACPVPRARRLRPTCTAPSAWRCLGSTSEWRAQRVSGGDRACHRDPIRPSR